MFDPRANNEKWNNPIIRLPYMVLDNLGHYDTIKSCLSRANYIKKSQREFKK